MKIRKLITFSLFLFLFVICLSQIKSNAETTDTFLKDAKSAILIEVNTGQILYEKNANEKLSPASMTKILSIYLIVDAIEKGIMKWDDVITVSDHAASMGGSQVYLETGEQMTVEELFKCMVIASGNDATVALAEQVAGSEELFVQKMNQKIQELGLKDTSFIDPTGLTDFEEGHYSTAHDMSIIARALINEYGDVVLKYTSIYEDYIRKDTADPFWLVNTNKLVKTVPGVDGLKTGWTRGAGYNLTATMKKDNMRLISVVMGEPTSDQRNYDSVKLLNFGFSQYHVTEYKSDNFQIDEYENILLTPQRVKIITVDPIYFVTKKGEEITGVTEQFTYSINQKKVKCGDTIGELKLIKDGQVIYTVRLTVQEDVEKANFFEVFMRTIKNMYFK